MNKDEKRVVCPACGADNTVDSKFCIRCGVNLNIKNNSKTKKRKWVIPVVIISSILLIAVAVVLIWSIGKITESINPVNQVVENIENNEYYVAKDIFEEKIKNDTELCDELAVELKKYLDYSKTEYYEEKITYEQMIDIIELVDSFDIKKLYEDVIQNRNYVNRINDSRTAFQTAEAFMNKDDYTNAILNYSKVDVEDSYYDSAQNKKQEAIDSYRNQALAEAEKLASEDDYVGAISVLKEASKTIQNDSTFQTQISVYTGDLDSSIINAAIEEAKAYHAKGDYENALSKLSVVEEYDNEMVNSLYSTYYNEFLTSVLNDAETVFKSSGHAEALSKLNEYSNYFSNENLFEEKKNYYSELAPVSLSEMKAFNCDDDWYAYKSASAEDHLGNLFDNCLLIETNDFKYTDRWAEYYVNSEYVSLTGTLALSNKSGANDTFRFEVYADDELVYSSPNIGAKTESINFNVNITGKKYIKIKAVGIKEGYIYVILSEAKLNKY